MIRNLIRRILGRADWPTPDATGFMREPTAVGYVTGGQAQSLATVCVNMIVGQLAPCRRLVVDGDGMEVPHPVSDLLMQPWSQGDAWTGWQFPLRSLLMTGNGYFIVRRGRNGAPVDLTPALEGGAAYDARGRVVYTLTPLNQTGASAATVEVTGRDAVAMHWHGHDGLTSPSPLRSAVAMSLSLNAEGARFLLNRLRRSQETGPAFAVSGQVLGAVAGHMTQFEEALATTSQKYSATRTDNRIPLLPVGTTGHVVPAFDAEDFKAIELLRWTLEDVARAYNISPSRLGQMSGGGAGVRTQALQDQLTDFEAMAIRPVAHMADAACTLALLTPEEIMAGLSVRTETWPIGLGSMEDRANIADQLVARAPILTPNEARGRLFGLPPVEGGDELRESKGAAPTGGDGGE